MLPYITDNDIPIGYAAPKWPSLTIHDFHSEFLYYPVDIWRFTLYWTLIMFTGFYGAAGLIAAVLQRNFFKGVFTLCLYFVWGATQAFVSATVVGFVLGLIYRSVSLTMNTWLPFMWALAQILYVVISSYSMSSIIL